jgi:ribosomal protein S18 acetylase RimI-like enzyme
MKQLTIRYVHSRDIEKVHGIEMECFPSKEASSMPAFDERIRLFPEGFLVGEVDGEIIGFISGIATNSDYLLDEYFESMDAHEMNGRTIIVLTLAVASSCQGNGYATDLMNAYIDEVERQGRKKIVLTCKEYLVQYYEKFGFVNEGLSDSNLGGAKWYDLHKVL